LGDRGALLADRAVDADEVAALLIDDGVEDYRGLAGLAVADDELALAAADRNHGVDGLDAGLHWFANGLAIENAGGDFFEWVALLRLDGAFAVERLA